MLAVLIEKVAYKIDTRYTLVISMAILGEGVLLA
jgi:hypothetical protein